ncbi:Hypothetical predicted protein, partial [Mytilus galloprovincialis]
MDLDKVVFIFGYLFIFVKFCPVSADGTHGHALSVTTVHGLKTTEESVNEENVKIRSEILKIPHDFNKIIYLDIVQYMETDVFLGTSTDNLLTLDLQTHTAYSFNQLSTSLWSSTVYTDNDMYIKIQVGEDPRGYTDYTVTTIIIGVIIIVLLSKLRNYKSKFKLQITEK